MNGHTDATSVLYAPNYHDGVAWFTEVLRHVCRLKVEAAYHSTHPQSGGGLTVTTHISLERLHRLESMCASWAGPLVVAGYLPLTAKRRSSSDTAALQSFQDTFAKCADVVH
jgi:nitrate reductase gamma subunit